MSDLLDIFLKDKGFPDWVNSWSTLLKFLESEDDSKYIIPVFNLEESAGKTLYMTLTDRNLRNISPLIQRVLDKEDNRIHVTEEIDKDPDLYVYNFRTNTLDQAKLFVLDNTIDDLFNDIDQWFNSLSGEIKREDVSQIIAQLGQNEFLHYFIGRFQNLIYVLAARDLILRTIETPNRAKWRLKRGAEAFSMVDAQEIFHPMIRDVGHMYQRDFLDINIIDMIGDSEPGRFLNGLFTEYNRQFLIKKTSKQEYSKALLYDRRPVIFGFEDKIKNFYLVNWAMPSDLQGMIDIAKRSLLFQEESDGKYIDEIVNNHLTPAFDWIIYSMNEISNMKGYDKGKVYVEGPYEDEPLEVILAKLDFAEMVDCRIKGEVENPHQYGANNPEEYLVSRMGNNEFYSDFRDLFLNFIKPLEGLEEAILPTLNTNDMLPYGYIIDAAKLAKGNPMLMFASTLNKPAFYEEEFEKYGVREGLIKYVLEKYNPNLSYEDKEEIYKISSLANQILEIGSYYSRLKKLYNAPDLSHQGEFVLSKLQENLRGLYHFRILAKESAEAIGEKGLRLWKSFEAYRNASDYSATMDLLKKKNIGAFVCGELFGVEFKMLESI